MWRAQGSNGRFNTFGILRSRVIAFHGKARPRRLHRTARHTIMHKNGCLSLDLPRVGFHSSRVLDGFSQSCFMLLGCCHVERRTSTTAKMLALPRYGIGLLIKQGWWSGLAATPFNGTPGRKYPCSAFWHSRQRWHCSIDTRVHSPVWQTKQLGSERTSEPHAIAMNVVVLVRSSCHKSVYHACIHYTFCCLLKVRLARHG